MGALIAAAAAAGCDAGDRTCTVAADLQPRRRLPGGTTFYLGPAEQEACAGLAWQLESAPAANANQVHVDGQGRARFTPVVPGVYRLRLGDSSAVETLTVIDPTTAPFHNYNYYPTASLATVGDELWVANVFQSTLARVDRTSLEVVGEVVTGPWPVAIAWRPGMDHALVAHKAGDTIGLVDVDSQRLVDSVWVGDEPTNIVVSPDGATAYVALSSQSHIAVVDLVQRALVGELPALFDVRGLALTVDGRTLYAARYRSGSPNRYPYEDQSFEDEADMVAIDVASGTIARTFVDVGTTLSALALSDDGQRLYLTATRNDPEAPLNDPSRPSWFHEVVVFDTATGAELVAADLSRQPSSGGYAVALYGMALDGDSLWVAAEGSNLAVELDASTLAELGRVDVGGRPRSVIASDGQVFVHGAQAMAVHRLGGDALEGSAVVAADPRPAPIARGQAYFTGAGDNYAKNWSCNGCHPDGLTDGMVWLAGPTDAREMSRPLAMLDATTPLGWGGYLSTAENFAYETTSNIGTRPTTEEAVSLGAYLASIAAPPAASQTTARDGGLSAAALRGKAIFDGSAGCSTCHSGPALTNGRLFEQGITAGPSDVPTLVGAYRYGAWLKHGEARTLREAALAAAVWNDAPAFADGELDDLMIYLGELTGRDFYLTATEPRRGTVPLPIDQPFELRFSEPVDAASAVQAITLVDGDGAVVPTGIAVDRNRVILTPAPALRPATDYRVVLAPTLESFSERRLTGKLEVALTTAATPALRLAGDYDLVFDLPSYNPVTAEFDEENTVAFRVGMSAVGAAAGPMVTLDYGEGLTRATLAVVDGRRLRVPPLPIPVSRSFAEGFTGLEGELVDADGDDVADSAAGTLTVTGPGITFEGVTWSLTRPATGGCAEGTHGSVAVAVDRGQNPPTIDWGTGTAIGVYVTDPAATLPMGPGTAVGGTTYWAIELASFPTGFAGPVTYGVVPAAAVDRTVDPNGGTFGPLQEGTCYKFSVVTSAFQIGDMVIRW